MPVVLIVVVVVVLVMLSRANGGSLVPGDITAHFSWSEFASPEARGRPKSIPVPQDLRGNTVLVCQGLEQLRAELGALEGVDVRLRVNSGYRTPAYNHAIGGAAQSQHMKAAAADVEALRPDGTEVPPATVQQVAFGLQRRGVFGGVGVYPSFTHVDVGPRRSWGETGERV